VTIKDFARRVVRYARRTILSRRQQMQGVLGIEWEHRHLRALAELTGVFDPEWYLTAHKDVAMSGIDPFAHYMSHGWRERRKPANGIDIEGYASLAPGFRPGHDNPIAHLLRNGFDAPHLKAVRMKLSERRVIPFPRNLEDGLCVSGYLCSEIGLGQAARNIVYACDAARLPVSSRALALPGRENDAEFTTKSNPVVDRKAQLVVTGLAAAEHYRQDIAPGRSNILFPFWELGKIPREWHAAIRDFDEVWAPSRFVASAFDELSGVTLKYVRQPVRLPLQAPAPRPDRATLRFFTYLDFDSYVARKNPQAAVNAFRAAFPPAKRDVELIVKTRGERDEGLRQWLGDMAAQDDRIQVVDHTLDRAGVDALMRGCDAFISLHRSEGFGFGAAEALAAGKAVVATDYGGTTDFINELTGYPVAYALEPVRHGEYVQTKGQVWATANADAAVEALRKVYDSPGEADARARRGFALLKEQQSLVVVGRRIAQILEEHGLIQR
jgi:glycosyltransferase involved in cell wall biosynthesis